VNGVYTTHQPLSASPISPVDAIEPSLPTIEESKPEGFILHQNYPNPFNPVTMIKYQLAISNYVDLSIYNLCGQKVSTLVSERQPAGNHKIIWDGRGFTAGVYYYQLKTEKQQLVRRMVLLK